MGIWEESRDYATVAASQTKASLGTGSAIKDGDVLTHLVIVPATSSPGSVTIYDGSSGTGIVVFVGGSSSVNTLAPVWIGLNARAKNSTAPRWLISTGANVSVIAVGTFH